MIKDLNDSNFKSSLNNNEFVLVDFYAQWCGPCRTISKYLDSVSDKLSNNAIIYKVDVEEAENISEEYNVQNLPCVILFKNGVEINRVTGNNQLKLNEVVNSL
jgi:thioredoxin 1